MSRLIDADALDEVVLDLNTNRGFGITRCDYKMIDAVLFEFPTIEERKVGKWIPHKSVFGGLGELVYTCDQCGYNIGFHSENFCPKCGSCNGGKMEGGQP